MDEEKVMENERVTIRDYVKNKWDTTKKWCAENRELVVFAGITFLTSTAKIAKIIVKQQEQKEERRLKERYIYDRSFGHYYEMRRKPTVKEWIEIESRKLTGEPLGYILASMRLI